MRYPALTLVIALTGCGSPVPSTKPTPTPVHTATSATLPNRISGQREGPWGTRVNEWRVEADGTVRLTAITDASNGKPPFMRTTRFRRPGALAALSLILLPVERRASLSAGCPADMTDQGFAHIDWQYGKRVVAYQLDDTCPNPEAGPIGNAIAAAETRIDEWRRAAADAEVEDKPQ